MALTTSSSFCALLIAATSQLAICQTNLLRNPSFEEGLVGSWIDNGFIMERTTADSLDGPTSLFCRGRDRDIEGPIQENITFVKGRHYVFEGYVKLLNRRDNIWEKLKVAIQTTTSEGESVSYNIVSRSFCDRSQGWIRLRGDIEAPQKDLVRANLVIRGPDKRIRFLVDNLTLFEVGENPNWRQQADVNIERHRKSNVTLSVSLPSGLPASDVDVEVSLKKHLFAFGSMMREEELLKEETSDYTKLIKYLFNWATIQSYKWKFNKGDPPDTNPNFSIAVNSTKILNDMGYKVRGHSIFWNVKKNIPGWVRRLPEDQLLPRLHQHLEYMVNLTRGTLVQFDIMNEHLADHYYEEKLMDPTVTKGLYRHARELNDTALLYTNEFQCITSGAQTEQYFDLITEFIREGVPVDGMGIQGHVKEYVKPDPTAMWRRIDRLAELGLELMMTEFDLGWPDDETRGDWFEDAIRAFFGHPAMKGVILWDFWNETMRDRDHGLVEGPNLTIVEPGQRWACLVKKEWTTQKEFNLADGTDIPFRGFQGDYEVVVKRGGVPVQRENFTLGKQDATWSLTVTTSTDAVDIPVEFDYVPKCISHREERAITTETTSTSDVDLTCRTVSSAKSAIGEDESVSVSCDDDEVMTGCHGFHQPIKLWQKNGERMEVNVSTGGIVCTAYNGRGAFEGVKAFARCCKVAGLTCTYKTAGPSFPFDGAMAEARCDDGDLALGCSAYQGFPDSDGVKPGDDLTSCFAQSGPPILPDPAEKAGSVVFAACCKAPRLTCRLKQSGLSALEAGRHASVSCPRNHVMTGCHAFAEDGKSAGCKIAEPRGREKCRAYIGDDLPPGSVGVRAFAVCCRVQTP